MEGLISLRCTSPAVERFWRGGLASPFSSARRACGVLRAISLSITRLISPRPPQ